MMHSVILTPAQALWLPTDRGAVRLARSREWARLTGAPARRRVRLPHYLDGDRASGDTLQLFKPQASTPPSTNYATFNTRNNHLVLEFDTTTQETSYFEGVMPRNYAGGNIVVSIAWMAATATTGTIGWGVTFERLNDANHDLDADAFATEQTITAATVDATSGKVKTTSVTITAGATGTDSVAAGESFRLRVRRDVANDTATGDAQLLSVEIKEA